MTRYCPVAETRAQVTGWEGEASVDPCYCSIAETRAQVTGWEAEPALSGDEEAAPSRLRQRAAALLPDLDPRYAGRAVSRSVTLW